MRVTLRLHDTATGETREFHPLNPPRVTLYLCGATAQSPPHIGHMRSAVCFDLLIRWLEVSGYEILFCRNVTDLDDKILRVAVEQNLPWWQLAERDLGRFRMAYDALGCRPPDVEPRVTGHIPQLIRLIGRLLDAGHAYTENGNVLFDVGSAPDYGTLAGGRQARDFTLWKAAEPRWESPWGPGRPGEYLGCSAMSTEYLGAAFDIHGGVIDQLFPHHENERAQATAAGDRYARYWWHSDPLGVSGAKPPGSLAVADVLARVRPQELRYYLIQAHYRSLLEFSDDALEEAASGYQRIERFVLRARALLGEQGLVPRDDAPHNPVIEDLPMSFADAMDADLGVPSALASLHATVRDGNHVLTSGDTQEVAAHLTLVRSMLAVLGLDPLSAQWRSGSRNERLHTAVDALVRLALDERAKARQRRDYATVDSITQTLEKIGVVVEDTAQGARWELQG